MRFKEAENSALSAIDKYCFCRNFLSNESNCEVVNGVLGFRLVLCFLSWHFVGLSLGRMPEDKKMVSINVEYSSAGNRRETDSGCDSSQSMLQSVKKPLCHLQISETNKKAIVLHPILL